MSEYNSDSIKILSDISHIRLRTGMYIGDTTTPYQLFSEVLDNAVDEYGEGYGDKIIVSVDTKDNRYTIRDRGRGIPHGEKVLDSGKKMEIVEVLLTKSNSGGKFDHNGYTKSAGLHGIGGTLTNALSIDMSVETIRDGKSVKIVMHDSEKVSLDYSESDEHSGTTVSFVPNPEFFMSPIIPFNDIKERCRILNAFGVVVELYKDGVIEKIEDCNTIFDLIPHQGLNYVQKEFKYISDNSEEIIVGIQYSSNTKFTNTGYTNYLRNRLGGTHCNVIYDAICDVWSEFTKDTPVILKRDDCTLGLDVLTAVFISEISFSSQTKEKLTTPKNYFIDLINGFKLQFKEFLGSNDKLRDALIKRFVDYRISQNKLLSQKEIMSMVKVNDSVDGKTVHRRSVVPGLIECTSNKRENTELYLVEGASAAGPVARARDKKNQSVLPLRGKIKNVTYMNIKDALRHETIRNIINAIGANVGDNCDSSKSRYERIMIMTDADPDGLHIAALITSALITITPNLVKDGLVYVVNAPLYGYTLNNQRYYCNDLSELPEKYDKLTRYKGLGEMDDDEFRDSCLIPGHRNIYRVNYPDNLDEFNKIMGTSEGRSKLLKDLGILVHVNEESNVEFN